MCFFGISFILHFIKLSCSEGLETQPQYNTKINGSRLFAIFCSSLKENSCHSIWLIKAKMKYFYGVESWNNKDIQYKTMGEILNNINSEFHSGTI